LALLSSEFSRLSIIQLSSWALDHPSLARRNKVARVKLNPAEVGLWDAFQPDTGGHGLGHMRVTFFLRLY
jgi:hypothetical protein